MPEIGEVARIVHYLRKHLVNRTVKICQGYEDTIVYGKVGCSAEAFRKAVEGKKVTGAFQQGKYFGLTFDSPPHAVMHLGMTGWIKFNTEDSGYYKQGKVEDKPQEEWPPRFIKWLIKCEAAGEREPVEVAFVDARRLARIRLVECDADQIRQHSPLKENGPDPVIDRDIVTVEWLTALLKRKKVPIKALLLDQANISGVGNWVADEILYQAKLHPEQYCNTFSDEQIGHLHESLTGVCKTACDLLADSSQFPEDWLMKYRWDKGKKGATNKLPNGAKIEHITVGGRTSAFVPSVQKKTAAVAGDMVKEESEDDKRDKQPTRGKKRKIEVEAEEQEEEEEDEVLPAKKPRSRRGKSDDVNASGDAERSKRGKPEKAAPSKTMKADPDPEATKKKKKETATTESENPASGARRSSRNKGK